MTLWRTATMDVEVDYDDVCKAHEEALERGHDASLLTVPGEVDLDEALEQASIEQLRDALRREQAEGYTQEQLAAIYDCFAAVAAGDLNTAAALLKRIFDLPAQIAAAEEGMSLYAHRRAA
jgi:hypothetical protein